MGKSQVMLLRMWSAFFEGGGQTAGWLMVVDAAEEISELGRQSIRRDVRREGDRVLENQEGRVEERQHLR